MNLYFLMYRHNEYKDWNQYYSVDKEEWFYHFERSCLTTDRGKLEEIKAGDWRSNLVIRTVYVEID